MTTITLSLVLERIIAVIDNSKYNPRANRKWLVGDKTHYTLAGAIELVCQALTDTHEQDEALRKDVRRLIVAGALDGWSKRRRLRDCHHLPDVAMITICYQEARKKKHVLAILIGAYMEALALEADPQPVKQEASQLMVDANPLMDTYEALPEPMRAPWMVSSGHLVAERAGTKVSVGMLAALPQVVHYLATAHNVIHQLMEKSKAEHGNVHHRSKV